MSELILINGEEEFLKERAAREEAESGLSDVAEYSFSSGLSSYEEDSSLIPLSGRKRAFIVWDAKEVPRLPAGPDDSLVVVSASKSKLVSPLARRSHNFPKLKAFDDKNEYLGWILKEGERHGVDLSRVCYGLFVNCGKSLRKISSEIRKLSVLVPSGTVSPEDARAVLCFSAEVTPKDVIDSICDGQPARALTYLDKLQEKADETGWVLAFLQRHVLQQMKMEHLSAAGVPRGDAAQRLGIHPFLYGKMLDSRLGLWSTASLFSSLETLCSLDLAHKRGSGASAVGLEIEVVRLSEEAKNVKRRSGAQ